MILSFSSQQVFRSILSILFITQLGGFQLSAQIPQNEEIPNFQFQILSQKDQDALQEKKSSDSELSLKKKLFWGVVITAILIAAIFIPIFLPFSRPQESHRENFVGNESWCEGFQVRGPTGVCYSLENNGKIVACRQTRCYSVELDGVPDNSYLIDVQKGRIVQNASVVSLDGFNLLNGEIHEPSYAIWNCLLSMKKKFFRDTSCLDRLESMDRSRPLYRTILASNDPLSDKCDKPDCYSFDTEIDHDLGKCVLSHIHQLQAKAPSLANQKIIFRLRYGEVGAPSFFVDARESLVIRADFAALWKYHFKGKRLSDHAIISMIAHELGHFIQNPKLLSYQGTSCSASSWRKYLSLNEELNADLIGQVLQVDKNNDLARSSAVAMLEFWRDDADQPVPDNVTIDTDFDGFQKTIDSSGQHADGGVALKGPHPIWSVRIASLLELFEGLKKIQLFLSEHSAKL